MAELLDNCRFKAGSTGTADFADGPADLTFKNLEGAGAEDGKTYPYKAYSETGTDWEIGRGTALQTSGGWILERTSIQDSSNGGSAVNFSTAPTVIITAGKAEIVTTNGVQALANKTLANPKFSGSINGGPLGGFRNKIINGDFTINQRAGTRTPGIGVYGYDRWKGHADGLEQIIEGLEPGEYTLTWSGGGVGTFAGVTAASPFKATSAGGNVSVVVPSNATRVSLVPGDATAEDDPFSPRHIQQELALCLRYYYSTKVVFYSNHVGVITISFLVPMRAMPSITATLSTGTFSIGATIDAVIFYALSSNSAYTTFLAADAEL